MDLKKVSYGDRIPDEVNVIIEISSHSDPVKYEIDKKTDMLFVDRFMSTSMNYPCEYGYIPHTLSEDDDPVDVLVICPYRLVSRSVLRCRPIGKLNMSDEAGPDSKLLAVPVNELTPLYQYINSPSDVAIQKLNAIQHFFEHYKDLEPNKWVKVEGWVGADEAKKEILESVERYKKYIKSNEIL